MAYSSAQKNTLPFKGCPRTIIDGIIGPVELLMLWLIEEMESCQKAQYDDSRPNPGRNRSSPNNPLLSACGLQRLVRKIRSFSRTKRLTCHGDYRRRTCRDELFFEGGMGGSRRGLAPLNLPLSTRQSLSEADQPTEQNVSSGS